MRMTFFYQIFILAFFAAHAMEKPEKRMPLKTPLEKENILRVKNETAEKIEIGYRYSAKGDLRWRTLISQQYIDLPRFTNLWELAVKPYGQIKGYTSREALTLGYWKAPRIIENGFINFLSKPVTAYRYKDALLELQLVSSVKPYHCILNSPVVFGAEEYHSLADAFPQVKEKLKEVRPNLKMEIDPRYFLSVGEWASTSDIEYARQEMAMQWAKRMVTDNPDLNKYAAEVLKFIHGAYNSLKGKDVEEFKNKVNREFITSPKKYDVRYYPSSPVAVQPADVIALLTPYILEGKTIQEAIKNMKAFLIVNTYLAQYLEDEKAAQEFIKMLAEKFKEKPFVAAFKLNTKGSRQWLNNRLSNYLKDQGFVFELIKRYSNDYYKPLVKKFIEERGNINVRDTEGNTPLIKAIEAYDFEIANFLLDENIAWYVRNNKGENAEDVVLSLIGSLSKLPEDTEKKKKLKGLNELKNRLEQGQLVFGMMPEYEQKK